MRFTSYLIPLLLISFITFGIGCSDSPAKRDFSNPYKLSEQEKALLSQAILLCAGAMVLSVTQL